MSNCLRRSLEDANNSTGYSAGIVAGVALSVILLYYLVQVIPLRRIFRPNLQLSSVFILPDSDGFELVHLDPPQKQNSLQRALSQMMQRFRTPPPPHGPCMGDIGYTVPENVQKLRRRAQTLFRSLVDEHFMTSTDIDDVRMLQAILFQRIEERLNALPREERTRLMKREHAPELCLVLGMDEDAVKKRFTAIAEIEGELGFRGKMPILDSIHHLILSLQLDNPFGEIVDEDDRKNAGWLTYKGIKFERGALEMAITDTKIFLGKDGSACDYMHGTTGAYLKAIYDDGGFMHLSQVTKQLENGTLARNPQDFGSGLYCFRENFIAALSFAIDQSWIVDKKRDNPSVIVLRDLARDLAEEELEVFDVEKQPFLVSVKERPKGRLTDRQLEEFHEYRNTMTGWSEDNQQWKQNVGMCLRFNLFPEKEGVYVGLLHDCDTVWESSQGEEPRPDKDGWIQYCIRRYRQTDRMGRQKLFLEFIIDWEEWYKELDGPETGTKQAVDNDVVEIWRKHNANPQVWEECT